MTEQVKVEALKAGESVKAGAFHAVYTKASYTWNGKMLEGMMAIIPGLEKAMKPKKASVSIRTVGE